MLIGMGKIMGIDYGARRVGVALSDDGHTFAFPWGIFENNDTLLDKLDTLIRHEGVVLCVVGEADNPAGGVNTIQRRVMFFAEACKIRFGIPVETVTEAYTSAQARRVFEEQVETRKDKKVPVDAAAATILLQSHLDTVRGGITKK